MNYALITGASKGIGRSLAFALAKRKINLLLVARSEALLKELSASVKKQYSVEADYLSMDLSHQDSPKILHQWCIDKGYSVNILINNAGYGLWGEFDKLGLEEQNNMMQLNMFSLINLTYEMLPLLKLNKQAYILNVASTAAYQAVPTLSLYAASKAFVLVFSRGLKLELAKTNVKVSCICPGPTSTGFIERAGMGGGIIEERAEKFSMTSDKVAEIAIAGMYAGSAEIIPGIANKVGAMFTSFAPKWITEKITAGLYKK
jgi:uncharacterized protein